MISAPAQDRVFRASLAPTIDAQPIFGENHTSDGNPRVSFVSRTSPCASIQRALLTLRSFASSVIQVKVGKEGNEQTFWAHQDILTSRSEFFKRATNGKWLESDERLVTLPEDKPDIFRLYLNLVYTKQIATKEWMMLCQMYVLAEVLQDVRSKNCIMDAMYTLLKEYEPKKPRLGPKSITVLYEGTPEGSKARELVADYFADEGHESWLQREGEVFPMDFVLDVASALFKKCPKAGWKQVPTMVQAASHYHARTF